jgi:hypothetical protein
MIEMSCPICGQSVQKSRESVRDVKNHVVCHNEYYTHYKDVNGNDILNKLPEALVAAPEHRFKH